jgi:DNA-binding NarL/FixJ family response regulator
MKLIVLETQGEWAAALRRLLPDGFVPMRETRSPAECDTELASAPASFVVAEVRDANALLLAEQLATWRRLHPHGALAIVAARQSAKWSELLLEAGAILVACSSQRLGDLVIAVRRHVARHPQLADSIADRIWAELPLVRD